MKDQWLEWLQDKQRHFFYGVSIIVALFFIAYQVTEHYNKIDVKGYLTTRQTFERFLLSGNAFEKLSSTLEHHPELEGKFGDIVASQFIARNRGKPALTPAHKILRRVFNETPEHAAYCRVSGLISKGNLHDALTDALALKRRLDSRGLLYGFNLVRIATLERALNDERGEQIALKELERYLQKNKDASVVLTECFSNKESTLEEYMESRKKTL